MKRAWTIRWAAVIGISLGAAGGAWADSAQVAKPSGAQLWAQNCARCHTNRSPSAYSNREWDLIMHQMRVRANLTKEEYDAIRDFLKSGN